MGENNTSFVISGPQGCYRVPEESFGKYLFNCLRKRDYDSLINVDAVTGEKITAGKFLEDSVSFATVLKDLSIKKGDAISIISENTLNYFVPVLSALYMGVVVCPLNPAYLTAELKHGLLLSKPKLVICSEKNIKTVLAVKEELEFIETILIIGSGSENFPHIRNLKDMLENVSADVENFTPEEVNCEEDGACVLLSSGTTGLPKGVLLTHQNLKFCVYLKEPSYTNLTSEDVTLLFLPFFHIFGFLVEVISIISCTKVVLLTKFKPDVFLQSLQEYQVTKLFMVPPIVLFLAKSPLVDNYELSSLKEIFSGAAPLGKDIQVETIRRLKTVKISQLYGITETGGPCTFHTTNEKPGCVGTLMPELKAKVINTDTKVVVGPLELGELCFKGPMVMKGYISNETATKESFDDEGFYHSGDLGYYDEQNFIYVVERMKELIKYKGFQVAPAELEALIITHPGVKECGVIGIPDERAGQLPFAFVVKQNGTKMTEQDIINYVAERISIQKHLHGGVKFANEIPKNAAGKILRRKLLEIYEMGL